MNKYYTYAYLREDRTPYYIGKGEKNRIYKKHQKGISVPKDKSRIIFLKQNLTEEDSFKHEVYMIAILGRKDLGTGILRNRTNGGEGHSGYIVSEECRKKRSLFNKDRKWWNDGNGNTKRSVECPGTEWILGRNEEHKKKKSLFNKGRKWWNDGCGNRKFVVECPGEGWILGMGVKK